MEELERVSCSTCAETSPAGAKFCNGCGEPTKQNTPAVVETNSSPLLETSLKKCPYCAEQIQQDAILCRYCNRSLNRKSLNLPGRKVAIALAVGLVLTMCITGAFSYASPYLTLDKLKNSVEHGDSENLNEMVNFPNLRDSLKVQFRQSISQTASNSNPFAALGLMIGEAMIDHTVDAMITPNGIAALLKGRPAGEFAKQVGQENPKKNPEGSYSYVVIPDVVPNTRFNYGYKDFNKFTCEISQPFGEPRLAIVLKRAGAFSWIVNDIIISPSLVAEKYVYVSRITKGSAAELAGLRQFDRVIGIDSIAVVDAQQVATVSQKTQSAPRITVLRDGQLKTITVKPDSIGRTGFFLSDESHTIKPDNDSENQTVIGMDSMDVMNNIGTGKYKRPPLDKICILAEGTEILTGERETVSRLQWDFYKIKVLKGSIGTTFKSTKKIWWVRSTNVSN